MLSLSHNCSFPNIITTPDRLAWCGELSMPLGNYQSPRQIGFVFFKFELFAIMASN
jgi:hypothetical protein